MIASNASRKLLSASKLHMRHKTETRLVKLKSEQTGGGAYLFLGRRVMVKCVERGSQVALSTYFRYVSSVFSRRGGRLTLI